MRLLLLTVLPFLFIPNAFASIPVGKQFGPWHVTWISSLSGVDGDDAQVMLTQHVNDRDGHDGDIIEAVWFQRTVDLSIDIRNCTADGKDFERTLSLETSSWLKLSKDQSVQVFGNNIHKWMNAAKKECTSRPVTKIFKMERVKAASGLFDDLVREFAPYTLEALNAQKN